MEALKKAVENAVTPEGRQLLAENLKEMKDKADNEVARAAAFEYVRTLACGESLVVVDDDVAGAAAISSCGLRPRCVARQGMRALSVRALAAAH